MHVVEIASENVESGLNRLLSKIIEVYGGEGRVQLKQNGQKGKRKCAFHYVGPKAATELLDQSLKSVQELQSKGNIWKYTQNIKVLSKRAGN